MDILTIPAGTVVHVFGMPVRLTSAATAEGRHENFTTEYGASPEFSGGWHRILGPLDSKPHSEGGSPRAPCSRCGLLRYPSCPTEGCPLRAVHHQGSGQ